MVLQAYRKLKTTFEDFAKPDGDKKSPAKTCKDLKMAYPEKESGEVRAFCIARNIGCC